MEDSGGEQSLGEQGFCFLWAILIPLCHVQICVEKNLLTSPLPPRRIEREDVPELTGWKGGKGQSNSFSFTGGRGGKKGGGEIPPFLLPRSSSDLEEV